MDNKSVNLTVSDSIVKEIVQAEISVKVCEALNAKENIIHEIVKQVLNTKVDADGKATGDSYYRTHDFINVILRNAIKDQAKEAVVKWVESQKDAIQKEMIAQLKKETKGIAKLLVDNCIEAAKNSYNLKVNILTKEESSELYYIKRSIEELQVKMERKEGGK